MSVIIYHNPECSKSLKTLDLIGQRGISPTIIEYLNNPPTSKKLKEILVKLKCTPRDLIRQKEAIYTENELDSRCLSDDDLIGFMIKYPVLIERPIVLANDNAIIGRPPEEVFKII